MQDTVAGVKRDMDWKKLLGSVTKSVDEELRLRNAYLVAENRILRQQINGRMPLTDSDRKALAEIAQFIAICSSSILVKTLGYAVSFSSPRRAKRRVFEWRILVLMDQPQPSTNADKLSDAGR
jgi:hypothetical protein